MVEVVLKGVTKRFGDVVAAGDINLKIEDGEFFTFLGPSGCGKTTTMRMVAGLEHPDEGRVYFGDKDVTELPPYKRNTGMVFQNYALWPHMKVQENVAYGLKVRKVPSDKIKKRVSEALELVKLGGLEDSRGWPSPECSSSTPRCCSLTSRSATWTRSSGLR
jgi:ABC-type Fe3+/spermidine/putrescine transport system ATPase subunit